MSSTSVMIRAINFRTVNDVYISYFIEQLNGKKNLMKKINHV